MTGTPSGLSRAEAERRLLAEGPNALPDCKRRSTFAIAIAVLREPMFLLLVAGSLIYLLLGDVREALVLASSIVVVMAIAVVQERKSERALEALRDLSSPRALVIRDGERRRVAGREVVREDLIVLAEGDRVPADAEVMIANDLLLDESLLTGESLAVEKDVAQPVYSGTLVVRGQGVAQVTATGSRTQFGLIGRSLMALAIEKTLLEREIARVVRLVAAFATGVCVLLSAYYIATRGDWLGGVLAGVTLAMGILPEEFPVVLTVFLALGAWRIAREGVLTRRMSAIETLGAATVLCVDKTGTLTENRMAVAEVLGEQPAEVLAAAALACEIEPFDPMERAIVAAAGPDAARVRRDWTLAQDYPLTPTFLAVCHGWQSPDGAKRIAVKGAPETVLDLCGLDARARRSALQTVEAASGRGLRLLAVAEGHWSGMDWAPTPQAYELTWLGFVALADPLRAEVPEAIAQCRGAGVRVVMITGDYPGTARAIASQAGIAIEEGILTGADIDRMDDSGLALAVRRIDVFARVRPEQKLRLVAAYKADGEIVAMTGDGVNDAPALKAAHIGIAMGKRGTDVAREASALVLIEDDFKSIVAAVRLGRRIYENIRNAMRYLLAVHVPIAGMSFLPLVFGWPLFLYPVHIVFLEFVIDPACSVVFEAERSEANSMSRPPRAPTERLFSARMVGVSLLLGASVLAATCLAYAWVVHAGIGEAQARAFGFATIVFGNLAMIHATRSRDRGMLGMLASANPALVWVSAGTCVALLASIYLPPVAGLLRFAPLDAAHLGLAALAGVAGVLWYEAYKALRPRVTRA